ncbi:hypothetical protein PHYBLDRAFT_63991 [Phycomyces blakesleeanus NRRL 1555(-)]|uniref:DDE Tnp4 domain-containing protein n=1 Tax=Phycomyces blakesleeanus (strain ATCC 8743b / DSM 1359 / FGSC 10004 / NBRC 33097 / NRRL 1555) TaxID=763407 RepID=A0A163DFS1_PHYB8|nr:hypothetical protein PHYBLDRAFT_63991 [Phycomyces blakesleeanus NRRL 1555(-)]OAD70940.1 hypothetical protein PHYBLDRAFT_63991 [Phycomyces blakesleeanus NRRL 1555(-)]|eukprot:XP_018288980.1 hypothetical protein PHYBLDRAFT_63991 [Phycomyces blakesleeanus NRRL 1555(-)]
MTSPAQRSRHRSVCKRLVLHKLSRKECISHFHFSFEDIQRITNALGMDETCNFPGIKIEQNLGLAILLNQYSFPRHLDDMAHYFGINAQNISRVCREMEDLLFEKMRWGMQFDICHFSPSNMERFSKAIFDKGAAFDNIVGFIDGTMQTYIYALKFQTIVTPDGITSSLLGPFIGSCHDYFINTISKIEDRLKKYLAPTSDPEKYYALYGDTAYMCSVHLYSPYLGAVLNDHDKFCNKSMSKVRVAVEWEFEELPLSLEDYISGLTRDKIEGEDIE